MTGPFIIIGIFILLGIILSMGKGAFLIAGYNTMPKEERQQYDTVTLCKFMGKVMFVIAFCITMFALSEILSMKVLFRIGLIMLWATIIFTLIYLNTGNRFKK